MVGHQQSLVLPFLTALLWKLDEAKDLFFPLKKLHQLIEGQEQLAEIILALWENGAVVTEAEAAHEKRTKTRCA